MKLPNLLLPSRKKRGSKKEMKQVAADSSNNTGVDNVAQASKDADAPVITIDPEMTIAANKMHGKTPRCNAVRVQLEHLKLMRSITDPLPRDMKVVVAFMQTNKQQTDDGGDTHSHNDDENSDDETNKDRKSRIYAISRLSEPWAKSRHMDFKDFSFLQDSCETVTASWTSETDNDVFLSGESLDFEDLKLVVGVVSRGEGASQISLPVLPVGLANLKLADLTMTKDESPKKVELDVQVIGDCAREYPTFRVPNPVAARHGPSSPCRSEAGKSCRTTEKETCCDLEYLDCALEEDEDSDNGSIGGNSIRETLSEEETLQYFFFRQGNLHMSITPYGCKSDEQILENEAVGVEIHVAKQQQVDDESPIRKNKDASTPPTDPLTVDQRKSSRSFGQKNGFSLEKARSLSVWSPDGPRFSRFFRRTPRSTPPISEIKGAIQTSALVPCASTPSEVEPKKLFDPVAPITEALSASKSDASDSTTSRSSKSDTSGDGVSRNPKSMASESATSRSALELVGQVDLASMTADGRSAATATKYNKPESREPWQADERSTLSNSRKSSWVIDGGHSFPDDQSLLTQRTLDSRNRQSRSLMDRLSHWAPSWTSTEESHSQRTPMSSSTYNGESKILSTETFDVITNDVTNETTMNSAGTWEDGTTGNSMNSVITTIPRPSDFLCGPRVAKMLECNAVPTRLKNEEVEILFIENKELPGRREN